MQVSPVNISPRVRRLAFAAAGGLLALLFGIAAAQQNSPAFPVLLAAAAGMSALAAAGAAWLRAREIPLDAVLIVKATHWVQPCVQGSILVALGCYAPVVRGYAPLILYQLCFAVLVQFFMSVYFRRRLEFSFAVFPIVCSINLFFWFQPGVFYCQLLMVAFAIAAKFFIVRADGKHIFNPSGLAMGVTIYALLALAPLNWKALLLSGELISAYRLAPDFFLFYIFAVSCISLYIADRFLVTIGGIAVMALAFFGAKLAFGHPVLPYVLHPNVFVGLTLLVTDPMTSPRNRIAQLLYGAAYGVSVIVAAVYLDYSKFTIIFDKILFLPFLNAAVPLFQKIRDPAFLSSVLSRRRVLLCVYAAAFLAAVVPYRFDLGCLLCADLRAAGGTPQAPISR